MDPEWEDALLRRLRTHVEVLAGQIGERNDHRPEGLAAAARYIREAWRGQGDSVRSQSYRVGDRVYENLEVARPAPGDRGWFVVGAHYDSAPGTPGADDNASGVAALLELSRWLTHVEPKVSVLCVAFANEEVPFFRRNEMGSRVYARALRTRGLRVHGMISLETLGYYTDAPGSQRYPPFLRYFYPDRGDFVAFVSDRRSRRLTEAFVREFRRHSRVPVQWAALPRWVPGVSWSDHFSFWRAGYRAFMVTDTAFYRYAHYHRPTDTPERLDYRTLAAVVEALGRTLAEWEG